MCVYCDLSSAVCVQTTLLKLLMRELAPTEGEVNHHAKLKVYKPFELRVGDARATSHCLVVIQIGDGRPACWVRSDNSMSVFF